MSELISRDELRAQQAGRAPTEGLPIERGGPR